MSAAVADQTQGVGTEGGSLLSIVHILSIIIVSLLVLQACWRQALKSGNVLRA